MNVMVRDNQLVVPTCPSCGCRLENAGTDYLHFRKWANWIEKDAQGCICPLIDVEFKVVSGIVTPVWAV